MEDSIKQFRVFFPQENRVVDIWSYSLEEAYREAGHPPTCELKVMVPGKGWRTICSLNLNKEEKDALLLP